MMKPRSVSRVFRHCFRNSIKVYRKMLANKIFAGDETAKRFVRPLSLAQSCLKLRKAFGAEIICYVRLFI